MIVLGLTGSIGMGKSTAAAMLARLGVPVHDSDEAARAALGPDGVAVEEVARLFPAAYGARTRSIDRKILGPIVFADREKKRQLEEIVHPPVQAAQQEFLKQQRLKGVKIAALDIPLLYETGADKRVDRVIVVTCPFFIQRRRVLSRPGMTEEKFRSILAAQLSDAEKRRRADFIVQTGLGQAMTFRSLRRILGSFTMDKNHDSERNHFPPFSP